MHFENREKIYFCNIFDHKKAPAMLDSRCITLILKEFMPETTFTLGFDEVNRKNKSRIIDNFISAQKLFGK